MENNMEMVAVVDKIAEKFGIVIDWTSKNVVPQVQDILERYCDYLITRNSIWVVISIVLIGVGIWGLRNLIRSAKQDLVLEELIADIHVIAVLAGFILGFSIFFMSGMELLELIICPEMAILEMWK